MPKISDVDEKEIREILEDEKLIKYWRKIKKLILENFDLNEEWYLGGKLSKYELKFRKSSKTIVSLFPLEKEIKLMIIFGKNEREKFEKIQENLESDTIIPYNEAKTYHDGKWVMYTLPNDRILSNLVEVLSLKRKPKENS